MLTWRTGWPTVVPGFALIFLLLPRPCIATAGDTAGYHGTIRAHAAHSCLTINYDISPYGIDPDSVVFLVANESITVYRRISETSDADPVYFYRMTNGELYLKDSVCFTLPAEQNHLPAGVRVITYHRDANDSTRAFSNWAHLYNNMSYFGLGMELWGISYGYFRSQSDSPLDADGLFLGLGVAMGAVQPRWSFMLSTSWSGLGKNFAFSEPFRGEFVWSPFADRSVGPELLAGGGLSKVKVKRDDIEYRRVKWGVDIGASLKVPFHRLSYRYNTAAGGYHTAALYVAMVEDIRSGLGTRYQLQTDGDIWTARVSFHFALFPANELEPGGGGSRRINRRDWRPWPLKAFAYAAALPYLPFALLFGNDR